MKQVQFTASATVDVRVDIKIEDINGVAVEIFPANNPNGSADNKIGVDLTTTTTPFTIDLTGARVVANWDCINLITDCPTIDDAATTAFDWTQITKIIFFPSGGTAYQGTITFDDLVIGSPPSLAVGKASAYIASSVVYPNPTSDLATVKLNLKSSSDVKVTLTDMMGREVAVVAETTTASLVAPLNVAGLTKGLYTVNYFINGAPAKSELLMVK